MLVPGIQRNDSVFLYIFHNDHHDKSSHHLNIQRYYIITLHTCDSFIL